MPEEKTKPLARKRKTKAARVTTSSPKAKSKPVIVSVRVSAKKPVSTKTPTKTNAPQAKRPAVPLKKVRRATTGPARKTTAVKKTASVTATQSAPIFQSSRPLTPLPKPLEITPQASYSCSYSARMQQTKSAGSQSLSLSHNLFTIFALTLVGVCALLIVASYANLTFQYIDIYSATANTILKPVNLTERSFVLNAGTFTVTYPESYAVTENSADTISWHYSKQPTTTAQLRLHQNDSDNVFTWLQANQPEYNSAKVITPTAAVEAVNGILVAAKNDDGDNVYVAYWPYQKNLAEKYIVEMMLVIDPTDVKAERLVNDLDLFVSGISINE